ncbi:hypothetical protein [Tolypothrix sp. PCC 7910]|uniref:hypothetical protein n=1 Tax=Tolypothrix sp. PCC 7910 TaxID=2099387 RepID=UPI001FCB3F5B|nr:hypothetical protein [Tolypothrix sp. PCC 7910]
MLAVRQELESQLQINTEDKLHNQVSVTDYQAIRDRILQQWRVSKRTESTDRIAQALDEFIAELITDGESSTPASTQASIQNQTVAPLVNQAKLDSEVVKQSAQIRLWLRVENNSKFIRRKKKVREHIERFCLAFYNAQKTTPNGCEYIITIPYENDEDLDKQVYDLFRDMDSHADMDYCFIEVDAHEIGTDRSW